MNNDKEVMSQLDSGLVLMQGDCVACINTNRKFIGIELDDDYFQIAKDRILDIGKIPDNMKEDDF